jgi:hypothetical protein
MAAQQKVYEILTTHPVQKINFSIEGFQISASRLAKVAEAVRDCRIKLEEQPSGKLLGAAYSPHSDKMSVGSDIGTSVVARAGVVHECVHALVDMFEYKDMRVMTDEAAAYLAENVYLMALKKSVGTPDAQTAAIYNAARGLVAKKKLLAKAGVRIGRAELEPLIKAINSHDAYRSIGLDTKTSGHGLSNRSCERSDG